MSRFTSVPLGILTVLLLGRPLRATEDLAVPSEPAANAVATAAVEKIRGQFEALRLTDSDVKLPPGWELPLTLASVERFFDHPLEVPVTSSRWFDQLEDATNLTDVFNTALKILDQPADQAPSATNEATLPFPKHVPPALRIPVDLLYQAIDDAAPDLHAAVTSVSPLARSEFLSLSGWPNRDTGKSKQEISARRTKTAYENMKMFDDASLYAAARVLIQAIDKSLPLLKQEMPLSKRVVIPTRRGKILLGTAGDDVYDEKDLDGVCLLIDLGGKNTYRTPVAAAFEDEIRVVIDLGEDIIINAENHLFGDAGSGVFGIGLLICPNDKGLKTMNTGPFSQGCGLGGVGVLATNGTARLSADCQVQGVGQFGIGLLICRHAQKSAYTAVRSGQGSGYTRGVGVFIHEGDQADIKGGLVQPDPREPLGSISICQGAGFGPRAYTGGGVGLALVKGNGNHVEGSYFSQGVGYWHGFGGFRVRGDKNTLQARRYDLGSGVHSAFGHFDLYGNNNRVLNWGVGPAYGWDHAAGSSLMQGNDNEFQTDWGAATASIGSWSFGYYQGDRNKLRLCHFASSNFSNDEEAYSLQVVEGLGNQMQCLGVAAGQDLPLTRLIGSWGVTRLSGVELSENLGLTPPVWPEFPSRPQVIEQEMVNLQETLENATAKEIDDQVADLVDVAAAFSVDKNTPHEARKRLLMLDPDDVPALVDILEPAGVDQLIQLRLVMPAHGDAMARAIFDDLPTYSVQKRATLINFLRMFRPTTVLPEILALLTDEKNDRIKTGALRTLASMLNRDVGNEPGPRAALEALRDTLARPLNSGARKNAAAMLSRMHFFECFGLLATTTETTPEDRERLLDSGQEDITSNLGVNGAKTFLSILLANRKTNLTRIEKEAAFLNENEPAIRGRVAELLTSTRAAVVAAGVVALGQIGNPDDKDKIAPLLNHDAAVVRESAAIALVRMGEKALSVLTQALKEAEPHTRATIIAGLTQATSVKTLPLLEEGLADTNANVRLTALAIVDHPPECLQPKRGMLVKRAKKALADDTSPDVQLALKLLK